MSSVLFYYRNPLGSIFYDPAGFVVLSWTDALITSAELQSLYSHTLQALRHHSTCKLLTNQAVRQPLSTDEQRWLIEQWIPQAIAECAYSHCAIVESTQADGNLAARAVGSGVAHHPLDFRYFEHESEARQWLQTA
ncbi:hypothetical protein [Hymenobacter sp. BRD67]|uniref:hypothetical protein n=1 Tax=Hymenobacter sp. BRD67 TaxID=2675877 RepID=UPI0015630561|nr:hypothetical protein [Hymenobacter sp. BRD67]QKG52499.1 hypothetical protein GKZ67_07665 [Hymenobacter sp. BRD67]